MRYAAVRRILPGFLKRHILHFEAAIEGAVEEFARALPDGGRVLDAGAGECPHAVLFQRQRYVAVDLGIGDATWDYSRLDCAVDLCALPFESETFDGCLNIVTLEHVREPGRVLREIARTLKPGGRLLLVVPHSWEVHQAPHDYYRYTRYGARYLLEQAGFSAIHVFPIGGYFRLLSRRLWNGLRYFRGVWVAPAAVVLAPAALVAPFFDFLDRDRDFTLGYICTAQKAS